MIDSRRVFAFLALQWLALAALAAGSDAFHEGVEAFRAGNYALAAARFEEAERAGRKDPALHFNLGSTYFKLGRYADARAQFNRIATDPSWGALAQYNLGMIEEHEGHFDAARQHYRAVDAAGTPDRLRYAASSRLIAMDRAVADGKSAPSWFGFISMGGGYDDNVTLTEDPSIVVSNQGDSYGDVTAALSGYLIGSYESGLRLDLSGFGEFYQDQHDYNVGNGAVGLAWSELADNWYFESGAKGDIQTAGQDVMSDTGTFSVRATRAIGSSLRLRLRGEGSWINGASSYDYLTGWRARGGTEMQFLHGSGQLAIGYLYEFNNRDDYQTTAEFFSYSPRRQTGYTRLEQQLGSHVTAELRAEYMDGKYPDDYQIVENGTTVIEARDDSTWTFGARLVWRANDHFNIFTDYQYVDAGSTIDAYRYTQNRAMAGIELQL